MRIGIVREFEEAEGTDPGVKARVGEAYRRLEKLGAELVEVSLPSFEFGISAYYLVAPAECSSNLAAATTRSVTACAWMVLDVVSMTSRTRDEGFGDEVKRRIMLGTYALSAGYYDAYYGKAQRVRTLTIRDLERIYRGGRPDRYSDLAVHSIRVRSEDRRSAVDVLERRFYSAGEPRRERGDQRAVRDIA